MISFAVVAMPDQPIAISGITTRKIFYCCEDQLKIGLLAQPPGRDREARRINALALQHLPNLMRLGGSAVQ